MKLLPSRHNRQQQQQNRFNAKSFKEIQYTFNSMYTQSIQYNVFKFNFIDFDSNHM